MPGTKLTKSQFVAAVAEKSGMSKKEASAFLDAVNNVVVEQLSRNGPGEVTIPGLLKLNVQIKPAVPEREGINRFTGQPTTFKAKPERKVVKARPVKALKDAV